MKRTLLAALAGLCLTSAAMAKDFVVAHVYDKTGPLEAYAKQTQNGLMLGLEYATQGTMTVAGRKIRVIEKDNQGKPDVARAQLASAYADDNADIAVGPTSSGVALAMLPIAEEYEKILLVACGEMGRSPRLNGQGGRDHWGRLGPLLLVGGGLPPGQVIGESNRDGSGPMSEAVTNRHLIATIMHTLFDVAQLRLVPNLPREYSQTMIGWEPIPGLMG